jgi:hypothetical protein
MYKSPLMLCILLTISLCSVAAIAEEKTMSPAAADKNKLESMMPHSAGEMDECSMHKGHMGKCKHMTGDSAQMHQKNCPMHKSKEDKCEHKKNAPCPYHPDNTKPHG